MGAIAHIQLSDILVILLIYLHTYIGTVCEKLMLNLKINNCSRICQNHPYMLTWHVLFIT